jgi:hypothetical protein
MEFTSADTDREISSCARGFGQRLRRARAAPQSEDLQVGLP